MNISTIGYNFAKVAISAPLSSNQKTEVGTQADFLKLLGFALAGGCIQVVATLDSFPMYGTALCNPYHDMSGVELGFVTAAGNNIPRLMVAQVTYEGDKCYCTIITQG